MKIVKATLADLKSILEINQQLHLDIPDFKWDTEPWTREEIEQGNFYVAKDHKCAYGTLCLQMALEQLPETVAYIDAMAVHEDKHSLGIGKQIVDFAINESKKAGKETLQVESFPEYNVKEFYIKCGFKLQPEMGEFNDHPYYVFSMNI